MKKNICLAANWDEGLLEGIAELNQEYGSRSSRVYEVFATLKTSPVGGGRPSVMLPDVTWSQAKDYVDLAHSLDLRFNYLLNATCMENREYHPRSHRELLDYLDRVVKLGADSVTIATPFLMEVVRDQYPDLEIVASTFCHIDSVRKAVFFEELGVNRMVIPHSIRRKFDLIKGIRRAVGCDLELLVTNTCIHQCPHAIFHANNSSHASQTSNVEYGGHYAQYSMFHCNIRRLSDPAEIIRAPWVRPEDVKRYQRLGIDFIKIEGRNRPTDWLLRNAEAHLLGRYDGNLFDLLAQTVLGYLQHNPLNPEPLDPLDIYLDNQALEGFLDFFEEGNCKDECSTCSYCDEWAEKAVCYDRELAARYIESAKKLLKHMSTSRFAEDFEEKDRKWREGAPRSATMVER